MHQVPNYHDSAWHKRYCYHVVKRYFSRISRAFNSTLRKAYFYSSKPLDPHSNLITPKMISLARWMRFNRTAACISYGRVSPMTQIVWSGNVNTYVCISRTISFMRHRLRDAIFPTSWSRESGSINMRRERDMEIRMTLQFSRFTPAGRILCFKVDKQQKYANALQHLHCHR